MAEITYYLAVDIGASSGRHILGWMDKGKIRMEEIYRFENKLEAQWPSVLGYRSSFP